MDLDTTEKTISVIVGVIVIGSTLYGIFRVKINGFVRGRFRARRQRLGKQCPRCRAFHSWKATHCGRYNFRFASRHRPRTKRRK
jgi:hypothetical protein